MMKQYRFPLEWRVLQASIAVAMLAFSLGALAGDVDNNNNLSASWYRTLNRNASTDSADIVAYNPGGVPLLKDGLYLNLSNQFVFREWSHTMPASAVGADTGVTFAAENPTLLFPALYLVFKRDNWGIYGAFTVPGGGGELEYDDGVFSSYKLTSIMKSAGVENSKALGSSAYYGVTLGGAWRPLHWLSVALGARMLVAKGSAITYMRGGNATLSLLQNEKGEPAADGEVIMENQRSALGVSGHLGLDFIPTEALVIGLRYEHQTALNWTNDKMFDGTASKSGEKRYGKEGDEYRRDLPGVVGLGVSYQFVPAVRAEASYSMYLNPLANWNGLEDDHEVGWETGLGIEYRFLNVASWMPTLGLSTGFLYANTGADSKSYDPLKPALDHVTWGGGIFAEITERLQFDLAFTKPFYIADSLDVVEGADSYKLGLDKRTFSFIFQMQARMF